MILELVLQFGPIFVLMVLGLVSGSLLERRHFASIRAREAELRGLIAVNIETPPAGGEVVGSGLVSGSVVVSLDYFKRFLAGFRMIFGGRLRAYEPLLERGRREALLRMKDEARRLGFDAVLNVRLETSRLASSNDGTTGVEMLAYGTAVKLSGGTGLGC